MGTMRADAELLPAHFHNTRGGPDVASKSACLRSLSQHDRLLHHLFRTQVRVPAWGRLLPQGFSSLCLRWCKPLMHRSLAYSECGGDVLLFPSGLMLFPGAHPSSFAPLIWRSRLLAHPSFDRLLVCLLSFLRFRSIIAFVENDEILSRAEANQC